MKNEILIPKRGGKRPGAGRKPSEKAKKVSFSVYTIRERLQKYGTTVMSKACGKMIEKEFPI